MVNNKFGIIKRFAMFLGGLLIFGNYALAETVTLKTSVENYVQGFHQYATVKLYANTGNANIGISNLKTELILNAPVILDKTKHTSVLEIGDNWLNNYEDLSALYNAKINAGLKSDLNTYSIPGSLNDILIATMTFKISETLLTSFDLDINCTSVQLFNIANGGYTLTSAYQFENQAASTPSIVTVPILKGFNFATKAGQEVTIAEDANSATPFVLAATDATYFESTEWNEAQSQLVAVVPPQAQFIGFSLTDPTTVRADYVTSDNDEKGSFSIVGGTIQYTQAANYFNAAGFTVWYEVESTSAVTPGAKDTGSILIKVTPVNDAPVVTITSISGQNPTRGSNPTVWENQHLVVEIEVTDVENDLFDINSITLGGNPITGNWAPADPLRGTVDLIPGSYRFTSTDPLSYDRVIHPAMTSDLTVAVSITDQGTPVPQSASASKTVTITDVDRAQSDPTIQSITPAAPYTKDALTVNFTTGTDPDGDPITEVIKWYKGEDHVHSGATLPKEKTAKNETFEVRIYTETLPYGAGSPKTSQTVTETVMILNSAPVAQNQSVFIQKMPARPGVSKEITLAATDADGDPLTYAVVDQPDPTKGSVTIAGNIATYTVFDSSQEFYDENADTFTFKATDNDGTPADSNIATVTVTYRENPPAEVVSTGAAFGSTVQVPEVDGNGDPSEITFSITATDDPVVAPAGIKKIAWSVAPEVITRTAAAWNVNPQEVIFQEPYGDVTQAQQCTITLPGYDTIDGSPRPQTGNFTVTVTVTDALDVDTVETWTVEVTDSDRKPTAPTSIVFNPAAIVADMEVTATANGGTDDDGDAVSYEYEWFTRIGETYTSIATGATLPADNPAVKKDNTLYVRAYSATTPYAAPVRNGVATVRSVDYLEASITVGNTTPVFKTFGPDNATTVYTWVMKEDCNTQTLVIDDDWVDDIDFTDGVDALTYQLTSLWGSEVGTLTYDANSKTISFTPAKDVNMLNLAQTRDAGPVYPSFEVVVSDEEGSAVAPAIVNIQILPVNDPPVLDAIPGTIYIVPDQMGTEWTATYTISMGGGTDEETQAIQTVDAGIPTSGAEIFAVNPVATGDGHDVTITFTVDADAALGSEAEFEITVTDDGQNVFIVRLDENKNTASKTIKVVLGATPWYPIYTLPCTGHPIHQVTILDGTTVVAELIVKGETLKPADYYNAGCEGFPAGAQYTVELRPWTASGGVGAVCQLPPEAPLNALELNVPDYNLPGKGILTFADLRTENKVFRINTPLSARYMLTITNTTTGRVKTVSRDFTPNADGLILPEVDLPMDFFAAGNYVATVYGTNPEGEGDESDDLAFTIADGSADTLVWPTQGFVPADAANILVPQNVTVGTVNFSWPVLSAAQSYNIVVTNSAGAVVARASNLTSNTWKAENLPAPKDFNGYAWWVEAVSANKRAVSFTWGFNLIKKTSAPLLNSVTAAGTNVILNFAAYDGDPTLVRYEVQYFSVDLNNIKNSKWFNFMMPNNSVPLDVALGRGATSITIAQLELGFMVKAGDFILLRPFVSGKQQGNFVLYSVQ